MEIEAEPMACIGPFPTSDWKKWISADLPKSQHFVPNHQKPPLRGDYSSQGRLILRFAGWPGARLIGEYHSLRPGLLARKLTAQTSRSHRLASWQG